MRSGNIICQECRLEGFDVTKDKMEDDTNQPAGSDGNCVLFLFHYICFFPRVPIPDDDMAAIDINTSSNKI